MSKPDVASEPEATFHRLTAAWIGGDFDVLERHYDDDIIGLEPEPPLRIRGKQRVLAEYRKFLAAGGRIDYLRPRDIDVQRFGDTAVLTYFFETRRTLPGGGVWEFAGKETLVFLRRDDLWKLAHWHFSIDPDRQRRTPAPDPARPPSPPANPLPEG
jgi:ketosteroid isomerase-like protein